MNILHAGKVLAACDGDGISLDAAGVEALRLALNGGGPLTLLVIGGVLKPLHAFIPVPEPSKPSTRIENVRADVKCRACGGNGNIIEGFDTERNALIGHDCPACGGSGREG